jgi:perosamine synthetase
MRPVRPFYFDMTDEDIARFTQGAAQILRSGTLILGEHTRRFEQAFAAYVGVKHAISVNTGSTALEILLRLQGVERRTVLVPTNTNFATVAAVLRAGGRVRYLDMESATFAPTLAMVQAAVEGGTPNGEAPIAGVLWVHIGGIVSADFPAVVQYCRQRGPFVLEDAAHAHGSVLGGVPAGNLADGAAFSFFPTKVMTTCEGGMITTNSDEQDYLARSFRNQGKRGMDYGGLHHDFGNSSRMTELQALLGSIQLEKLPQMLKRRAAAARAITRELDRAGISYCSTAHMDAASHYKLIVHLPEGASVERVRTSLAADGVIPGGGVYELPCHRQPVFAGVGGNGPLPEADKWCPNHLCPPLTSGMTEEDAAFVGQALVKHLR